ncbi:MAG: radical SAM protein, partial [Anaerolineae bacterium]
MNALMPKPNTIPLSLLIKPVSGECNLNCSYCFYHERATDPYHSTHHRLMSREVLDTLIQQGMALNREHAAFGWQGGEPTLAGLDFFQQVVALQQRYGQSGQVVSNGLQTNGLLLDAEWARFLREYRF